MKGPLSKAKKIVKYLAIISLNENLSVWLLVPSTQARTSTLLTTTQVSTTNLYRLLPIAMAGAHRAEDNKTTKTDQSPFFLQSRLRVVEPIYHSYRESVLGKLFSSVPKRKYALENISLEFMPEDGVILLVGASACGKSTLLRVLSGSEKSSKQGLVRIEGCHGEQISTKPVILDRFYSTINTAKHETIGNYLRRNDKFGEGSKQVTEYILQEILKILGIDESIQLSKLTTSEILLVRLGQACFESLDLDNDRIHAPILFLDEFLDMETSDICSVVGRRLKALSQNGAVVVVATHKPVSLLPFCSKKVLLVGGKVLSIENPTKGTFQSS